MYTSKPAVGGHITSNISDDDCASARAFGLREVITSGGGKECGGDGR